MAITSIDGSLLFAMVRLLAHSAAGFVCATSLLYNILLWCGGLFGLGSHVFAWRYSTCMKLTDALWHHIAQARRWPARVSELLITPLPYKTATTGVRCGIRLKPLTQPLQCHLSIRGHRLHLWAHPPQLVKCGRARNECNMTRGILWKS